MNDRQPEEEHELSLDELSQAYARLIGAESGDESDSPSQQETTSVDASADSSAEAQTAAKTPRPHPSPAVNGAEGEVSPRGILEAVLFVGHPENRALSAEEIAGVMRGVEAGEVESLVQEINQSYEVDGCPYEIVGVEGGYRMTLRKELEPVRERLYGRIKEARLSQAAIDVLSVVAYNQPVTRKDVDRLRGKSTGAVLAQLVRRGLLRIDRPEESPRAPSYRTTHRFLEVFQLQSLDDLPHSEELTG